MEYYSTANEEFQGKDILVTQEVQSNNDNIQIKIKVNPLEKILNNPGLVHLAKISLTIWIMEARTFTETSIKHHKKYWTTQCSG